MFAYHIKCKTDKFLLKNIGHSPALNIKIDELQDEKYVYRFMKLSLIIATSLLFFFSGCATIIGESAQLMPINSSPSDANVVIIDEKGMEIFKGKTPTTITLAKSDGSYWGGKSYKGRRGYIAS